jgi:hypothetical protein
MEPPIFAAKCPIILVTFWLYKSMHMKIRLLKKAELSM